MKRLALNASPRGGSSNSAVILGWTVSGIVAAGAAAVPIISLAGDPSAARAAFLNADEVIVAFPLYTDFVPGLLKEFLDSLVDIDQGALRGKRLAWIVHSGFSESIHSETVAAWLPRATERLGMTNLGVIVKAGSEGFRLMPPKVTKAARDAFSAAGGSLVSVGSFDPSIVQALAKPRTLGPFTRAAYAVLRPTGLLDAYWNMMLKKHRAMGRRFDAPYGKAFQGADTDAELDIERYPID